MAKKRKKIKQDQSALRKELLRRHIRALQLSNETEYIQWCFEHGFRAKTTKSELNLRQERRYYYENSAFKQLKHHRKKRRLAEKIIAFCGDISLLRRYQEGHDYILTMACQNIQSRIRTSYGRALAAEFIEIVEQRSNLLDCKPGQNEHPYLSGLINIASYQQLWVRSIKHWNPRTHNTDRQFSSLLKHMLAQYQMPTFFDSVWLQQTTFYKQCQRWYVQIALGQSPRLGETPIPMTRKVAHLFMQAPADLTVIQAIRWSQILSLGGDKYLFDAIRNTRLGRSLSNNDFWLSVLRFFVAHPFLERAQVGPICDYLQNQKFTEQVIYVDDYQQRRLPPPQPNLSMRGRTPQTLIAQVKRWHRMLGRDDNLRKSSWLASEIKPLHLIMGKDNKSVEWKVVELLSHKALAREGSAMDHCVVTYARSCINRNCSIWSMTSEDAAGNLRRRQTIEVRRNKIVQSRGASNRDPDKRETMILDRWASVAGLALDL